MKSCIGELSFVLVASDRNANPPVLSPERGNISTHAARRSWIQRNIWTRFLSFSDFCLLLCGFHIFFLGPCYFLGPASLPGSLHLDTPQLSSGLRLRCPCPVQPPPSCRSASRPRHRGPHLCASVPCVDARIRDSACRVPLYRWQVCPLRAGPCLTSLPAPKGL